MADESMFPLIWAEDDTADLAKVVEEAVRAAVGSSEPTADKEPETTSDPPKEDPPPDYETLLQEGRWKEAAEAMQRQVLQATLKQFGPVVQGVAQSAREIAKQRIPDFDKWLPEVEAEAKRLGVDLNTFTTPEQWIQSINYVRAKPENIEKIVEEAKAQGREEALKNVTLYSGGSFGEEDRDALRELDEDRRAFVAQLGFDPKSYKRSAEVIDRYTRPDGTIEDVPVIDEDIPYQEGRSDTLNIEPGKF